MRLSHNVVKAYSKPHYVVQASLEHTAVLLPHRKRAGITGVNHFASLINFSKIRPTKKPGSLSLGLPVTSGFNVSFWYWLTQSPHDSHCQEWTGVKQPYNHQCST